MLSPFAKKKKKNGKEIPNNIEVNAFILDNNIQSTLVIAKSKGLS